MPDDLNLATSEQTCQTLFNGHLASIHSAAENAFLSRLVDPDAVGNITARIGGVAPNGLCSGPAATYAWLDGTPWDYRNWRTSTGEPNCSGVPGSIQFWPDTNGSLSGWNDVGAGDPLGNFICEYPKNPF